MIVSANRGRLCSKLCSDLGTGGQSLAAKPFGPEVLSEKNLGDMINTRLLGSSLLSSLNTTKPVPCIRSGPLMGLFCREQTSCGMLSRKLFGAPNYFSPRAAFVEPASQASAWHHLEGKKYCRSSAPWPRACKVSGYK